MESTNGGLETNTQTGGEFITNPETKKLVYDGHEYNDSPRVRQFIVRANAIKANIPSVQDNTVRLWRGNRPGELGQNPSFTNSLVGIALPFLDGYEGELTYVDIPTADANKYLRTGVVAENSEFILSKELAKTAKIAEDPLRPKPPIKENLASKSTDTISKSANPPGWE